MHIYSVYMVASEVVGDGRCLDHLARVEGVRTVCIHIQRERKRERSGECTRVEGVRTACIHI